MKPLRSLKIMAWMGVWSGGLIGLRMFDVTVSDESYLEMLHDWLLPQLQQIDIFNSGELFFQARRCATALVTCRA